MIELDVQSSEKGQGRESLQSPLVLLYYNSYRYNLCYNTHALITHNILTHVIAVRLAPTMLVASV